MGYSWLVVLGRLVLTDPIFNTYRTCKLILLLFFTFVVCIHFEYNRARIYYDSRS